MKTTVLLSFIWLLCTAIAGPALAEDEQPTSLFELLERFRTESQAEPAVETEAESEPRSPAAPAESAPPQAPRPAPRAADPTDNPAAPPAPLPDPQSDLDGELDEIIQKYNNILTTEIGVDRDRNLAEFIRKTQELVKAHQAAAPSPTPLPELTPDPTEPTPFPEDFDESAPAESEALPELAPPELPPPPSFRPQPRTADLHDHAAAADRPSTLDESPRTAVNPPSSHDATAAEHSESEPDVYAASDAGSDRFTHAERSVTVPPFSEPPVSSLREDLIRQIEVLVVQLKHTFAREE